VRLSQIQNIGDGEKDLAVDEHMLCKIILNNFPSNCFCIAKKRIKYKAVTVVEKTEKLTTVGR